MHEHICSQVKSPRPRIRVRRLIDLIACWMERRRQRRNLSGLTDYMLRDIGLSRANVEGEATKPFWMV
jgi:uncharacterized protein YjiS (DUF1127 family)